MTAELVQAVEVLSRASLAPAICAMNMATYIHLPSQQQVSFDVFSSVSEASVHDSVEEGDPIFLSEPIRYFERSEDDNSPGRLQNNVQY